MATVIALFGSITEDKSIDPSNHLSVDDIEDTGYLNSIPGVNAQHHYHDCHKFPGTDSRSSLGSNIGTTRRMNTLFKSFTA